MTLVELLVSREYGKRIRKNRYISNIGISRNVYIRYVIDARRRTSLDVSRAKWSEEIYGIARGKIKVD